MATPSCSQVPNVSRPYSSIVLGGTAGLRVLRLATPQLASQVWLKFDRATLPKTLFHIGQPQILGNITAALSSVASGMKTSARILPGLEEAQDGQLADFLFSLVTYLQGWVTANYLAGSFEVGNKVGNDVGNQVGNKVGNKETQPRGALDWGGASAQVCLLTSEV